MSNFTEVKIVRIETVGDIQDIGAVACRALPPGRRHRYVQAMKYTLENGNTLDGIMREMTKPKLRKKIEDYQQRYVPNGCFVAVYENGEHRYNSLQFNVSGVIGG